MSDIVERLQRQKSKTFSELDVDTAMDVADEIIRLRAREAELVKALDGLADIIAKAGLMNLSKGVELRATSWYAKATDRMEFARVTLARVHAEKGETT